jgi:CelD/BcsL family acetyltransferase involved in cellulose biosynthesis
VKQSATGRGLRTRVIASTEGLNAIEGDWRRLLATTPAASGFESLPWIRSCWHHLTGESDRLYVTAIEDHREALAIFPTVLRRHGRLEFIGTRASNYSGPVYEPDALVDAVNAWAEVLQGDRRVRTIDLSGLREASPFFVLLRERPPSELGRPTLIRINECPEVDLTQGWDAVYARHKSRQRANWRRKENRLGELGDLEFEELRTADAIDAVMPRLFALFEARWGGAHLRESFSARPDFHLESIAGLASEGHALVSVLRLDGEVIAFSYGVRAGGVTTSYVLAHDERFNVYSVGLLLLVKLLERAAQRGDMFYDFSLGELPYKQMWMTRETAVYRALWGRGRYHLAAGGRAWVAARSITWLRELKVEGPAALLGGKRAHNRRAVPADAPGLAAGQEGSWRVCRVPHSAGPAPTLTKLSMGTIEKRLSPRLVELALERCFRGDRVLAVETAGELIGIVWEASSSRRCLVAADGDDPGDPVYYHPVAAPPHGARSLLDNLTAARGGACRVVIPSGLDIGEVVEIRRFSADFHFSGVAVGQDSRA